MTPLIKVSQKVKTELWWLMISVDFNYNRICIADHEVADHQLILWLEDKYNYKNTLDECLQLSVPLKQFSKLIKAENLNSYECNEMHNSKKFLYKTHKVINEAITWYMQDATNIEQQWAREAVVKHLLTQLVENEIFTY